MFNGEPGPDSAAASRNVVRSSSISGEICGSQQAGDGTGTTTAKKRRSSLGAKMVAIVGLTQWSKSTLQLPQAEGATKKLRSNIRRSTETGVAVEMRSRVPRQGSRESTDGSTNSNSSDGTFIFPTTRLGAESQFSDFLDGLGPAQIVGRQTLATPPMGSPLSFCLLEEGSTGTLRGVVASSADWHSAQQLAYLPHGLALPGPPLFSLAGDVHIAIMDRSGQLEVEVIEARGLTPKPGSKSLPAIYIKVYLLENGACLAKKKTKVTKKTCDPLYQQALLFDEGPQGKVLQVIVWGDYGRMDHKCFMGMAQIMLDELDLSAAVTGWYKLFPTSSVADSTLGSLTRRLSQSSLESATSPSCP
ncbi:regulating synaptic membrane exocytosis protein 3-like protein [Camelus ferus]|nr:regulating synaptic membrane exocytosis protein 3-like protein [Camelus ferus]